MAIHTEQKIQPPLSTAGATWFNVNRGEIINHTTGEKVIGISGHVVGVRTRKSQNFDNHELHVMIEDGEEKLILSCGLFFKDDLQTFPRMLIGQLGNRENRITPADRIRIEAHPRKTAKGFTAGLCYIAREEEEMALPERRIENDDDLTFALAYLATTFPWPGDSIALPSGTTVGALTDGNVVEAEIDPADQIKTDSEGDDLPF
jgi:hypothetical protein